MVFSTSNSKIKSNNLINFITAGNLVEISVFVFIFHFLHLQQQKQNTKKIISIQTKNDAKTKSQRLTGKRLHTRSMPSILSTIFSSINAPGTIVHNYLRFFIILLFWNIKHSILQQHKFFHCSSLSSVLLIFLVPFFCYYTLKWSVAEVKLLNTKLNKRFLNTVF